jgi:tetratricopeptide (TPR) repeat protein
VTRAEEWRDNYSLFEAGARVSPNSYRANASFGLVNLNAARVTSDPDRQREFYAAAAIAYRRAVAIYGERAEDWFSLGLAEANSGNPDRAIEAYTRVQTLNPGHAASCYNLGGIFVDRHDYRRALESYACTEKTAPDFMDLKFMMGKSYQALGEPARAVPFYEAYLRQHPNDRATLANLVQVLGALGNAQAATYYASRLSAAP